MRTSDETKGREVSVRERIGAPFVNLFVNHGARSMNRTKSVSAIS